MKKESIIYIYWCSFWLWFIDNFAKGTRRQIEYPLLIKLNERTDELINHIKSNITKLEEEIKSKKGNEQSKVSGDHKV